MNQFRRHLTYANVMSTLAAFVAVAGSTAYAADHLGPDSVGAAQTRPAAVTVTKARHHSPRGDDHSVPRLSTAPSAKRAEPTGQEVHVSNVHHGATAVIAVPISWRARG
jgi:hypothetical protein